MSSYFKKQKQKAAAKPSLLNFSKETIEPSMELNQEEDYSEDNNIPSEFLPKEEDSYVGLENKNQKEYFLFSRYKKFESLNKDLKTKIYLAFYFSKLDEDYWDDDWLDVKSKCEKFLESYYTIYIAGIENKIKIVENSIDCINKLKEENILSSDYIKFLLI
jgi:hypothetical protein